MRWGLRAERGACVFLGAHGCTLPPGTRPTACLLYPFEPAEHGWTLAVERSGSVDLAARSGEPRCLAAEEARSRGGLLRELRARCRGLDGADRSLAGRGEGPPGALGSVKPRARSLRRRGGGTRSGPAIAPGPAAVECWLSARERFVSSSAFALRCPATLPGTHPCARGRGPQGQLAGPAPRPRPRDAGADCPSPTTGAR